MTYLNKQPCLGDKLTITRFLALDTLFRLSPELILNAGNQWAKTAKSRVLADLDDLNLEKLMVGSYIST